MTSVATSSIRLRRYGRASEHQEQIILGLLLLVLAALGTYYALDNPLYCKPDEAYHYAYVAHLRSGKGLPLIDTTRMGLRNDSPVEMEGHQPPFYYATVAAITLLLDMQDRVGALPNPHFLGTAQGNRNPWTPAYAAFSDAPIFFTGRLVSLACGMVGLVFSYLLVRLFLPWPLATIVVAFIGLNPQFLFITTSFSNDAAALATVGIGLWQLGRAMQKGLNLRRSLALGLTVAVATLTKLTGLGLLIPLGAIALWQTWRTGKGRPLLWAGVAGLITLIVDSWWLWRNWILYGNPFATNLLTVLLGQRATPWTQDDIRAFFLFLWKSYWLDFSPGGILFAERPAYAAVSLVCALSAVGTAVFLARERSARPLFLLAWGWFVVVLGSLLRLTKDTAIFMGGGRLLFPAAIAVGVTMSVGLTEISLGRPLIPTGLAVLLGVCAVVAPLRYLHPAYPRPVLVRETKRPPTHPMRATFGNRQIELVGYDLELVHPEPGQHALAITYHWLALQEIDRNYSVFIHLEGQEQEQPVILTQLDTYPGYGTYPTSVWRPGWVFVDRLLLLLPPSGSPFSGRVVTGLYYLPTMERLPAYDRYGQRFPADAVPIARIEADEHTIGICPQEQCASD